MLIQQWYVLPSLVWGESIDHDLLFILQTDPITTTTYWVLTRFSAPCQTFETCSLLILTAILCDGSLTETGGNRGSTIQFTQTVNAELTSLSDSKSYIFNKYLLSIFCVTGIFQALGIQQPRKAEKNPTELTFLCKPSLSPTALNVDSCADSFFSLSIFIIKTQMEMGGQKSTFLFLFQCYSFVHRKKYFHYSPLQGLLEK